VLFHVPCELRSLHRIRSLADVVPLVGAVLATPALNQDFLFFKGLNGYYDIGGLYYQNQFDATTRRSARRGGEARVQEHQHRRYSTLLYSNLFFGFVFMRYIRILCFLIHAMHISGCCITLLFSDPCMQLLRRAGPPQACRRPRWTRPGTSIRDRSGRCAAGRAPPKRPGKNIRTWIFEAFDRSWKSTPRATLRGPLGSRLGTGRTSTL